MRIRLHEETDDRKPLPGTGQVLAGADPEGLVAAMHQQTPFTSEMPIREYMEWVLARVAGPGRNALPDDPQAAAVEFLTVLGKLGRIAFMPEEGAPGVPAGQTEEANPCAAKQA